MDHDVLKFKDKFDHVLRDDEQVLWTGDINKKAYKNKVLRKFSLYGLLFIYTIPFLILFYVLFPITFPIFNHYCKRGADNMFLCITDRQVLIRKGIYKTDIIGVPYSSIGKINMITSIFDCKGEVKSSDLILCTKNQMSSVVNELFGESFIVSSLNYVDEAYKLITKMIDNSEIRIKSN